MCADWHVRHTQRESGKVDFSIRLWDENREVRKLFAERTKKVYAEEAYDYPDRIEVCVYKRWVVIDMDKYGPINRQRWRVPFKYLDKKGAREWLRSFFDGDGHVWISFKHPHTSSVCATSINLRGLEDVQKLLKGYFGIESTIQKVYGETSNRNPCYE